MRSPVLLIAYCRPKETRLVLDEILKARPPRLYVAVNAAPHNRADLEERVDEVKDIIAAAKKLLPVKEWYRDSHLPVGQSVSSAVDWFFASEGEGVVLEDDCLPSPDFFPFCDFGLETFRQHENVWMIAGSNPFSGEPNDAPAFLSTFPSIWGWATWANRWAEYDFQLAAWQNGRPRKATWQMFRSRPNAYFWRERFDMVFRESGWDSQLAFSVTSQEKLVFTSRSNLISNIGVLGEHSSGPTSAHFARLESISMVELSQFTEPANQLVTDWTHEDKWIRRSTGKQAFGAFHYWTRRIVALPYNRVRTTVVRFLRATLNI